MSIANEQSLATVKNLVKILLSIICVCLKLQPSHQPSQPTISPNLATLADKLCFVYGSQLEIQI